MSRCMIPFHQGDAYAAASAEQGRDRETLPPKMVSAAAGNIVPNHLPGSSDSLKASRQVIMAAAPLWGKPRSQVSREHSLTLAPKTHLKWVQVFAS